MTRVRIEVCVDDLAGLRQAIAGGADRIELCSRLDQDGLTPTDELLTEVARLRTPVRAMIRPNPGPFTASSDTLALMKSQIDRCRDAGCEGVVFGLLDTQGALDRAALSALCDEADGLGKTLHRAVDQLADPRDGVAAAEALAIDTILSSGGAETALEGLVALQAMAAIARNAVIMPGAGVSAENAAPIAAATGTTWLHGSFRGADGVADATQISRAKATLAGA